MVRWRDRSRNPSCSTEQTEEFVSHLFDAGHLTEAKRLAVTLRVQLHHGLNGYF
jgi:hypothetical protein